MQQNITNHYEEIKQQIEIIKSTIKEKIDPQYWEQYEKFATSVEDLVAETEPLFLRGDDGKLPEISLEKRDGLLKKYQAVGDAINFVQQNKELNLGARQLNQTASKIGRIVTNDINSLVALKAPATFADVIETGRRKVIDITGQKTKQVGANLSSRTVIDKGNGQKGVFTKATQYDAAEMRRHHMEKYCMKYPEYAPIFQALNHETYFIEMRYRELKIENGKPVIDINGKEGLKFPNISKAIKKDATIESKFYQLQRQPGFAEIMYSFYRDSNNLMTSVAINGQTLKVERNNEYIDDRNVGMSIVAGLLGMPDVIAHSENVVIKTPEGEIKGTVMDFAEGKDINTIAVNDPMRRIDLTKKASATPEAKKTISNLEILDFICGNVDRHGANMFYQIDDSNPKKPALKNIVGIDNDASFGIFNDNQMDFGVNNMTGLDKLSFIDQKTAEKVLSLTPGMLKLALQGTTINPKAIDNACERLTKLQTKLSEAIKLEPTASSIYKDKLHIMSDENWKTFKLSTMAQVNDRNYFKSACENIQSAKNIAYDLAYRDQQLVNKKALLNDTIRPINGMLVESSDRVKSGIWRFRGSSKQYNDIKRESEALRDIAKTISVDSTSEEIRTFVDQLKTTKEHVKAYLDRKELEAHPTDPKKKPQKFGKYTKNRISIMSEFYDRLTEKETKLLAAVEEKDKAQMEKDEIANLVKQAKELASQKLAKKIEKDLNKGAVDNVKKDPNLKEPEKTIEAPTKNNN